MSAILCSQFFPYFVLALCCIASFAGAERGSAGLDPTFSRLARTKNLSQVLPEANQWHEETCIVSLLPCLLALAPLLVSELYLSGYLSTKDTEKFPSLVVIDLGERNDPVRVSYHHFGVQSTMAGNLIPSQPLDTSSPNLDMHLRRPKIECLFPIQLPILRRQRKLISVHQRRH